MSGDKSGSAGGPGLGPLPSRLGRPENESDSSQEFDWGHAEWLIKPDTLGAGRASVGRIVFHPGRNDLEHQHFGEEQILHILSGRGSHILNGRRTPLKTGDTFHLPPFSRHQVINESDEELHILAVYIPAGFKASSAEPSEEPVEFGGDDLLSLLDAEVIREQLNRLALSMGQSIRLIAADGSILINSDNLPPLCQALGECGGHCQANIKAALEDRPASAKSRTFHCCGRVTSIIIPIVSGSRVHGYIKCGEFFISAKDREDMLRYLGGLNIDGGENLLDGITVDKINMIHTAAANTVEVARHIAEMSLAMVRQLEREEYRLSLMRGRMVEAQLKEALKEADLKLLQSQLNPHFLFNTLNTISHLAYLDGADRVSDLVCALSNLLKAALGKVKSLVTLEEELELLREYLVIQKARFGERLQTDIEVDPTLNDLLIPALTLQPIVENSIIHGVESCPETCRVAIRIVNEGHQAVLTVDNDGPGLCRPADESSWGVGLRSIKARLRHHYGDNFYFSLADREEGGVRTTICISMEF